MKEISKRIIIVGIGSDVDCRNASPTKLGDVVSIDIPGMNRDAATIGKCGRSYYITLQYSGLVNDKFIDAFYHLTINALKRVLGKRLPKYIRRGALIRWYGTQLRPTVTDAIASRVTEELLRIAKGK